MISRGIEHHKTALVISQNWLWFDAVMGLSQYKDPVLPI